MLALLPLLFTGKAFLRGDLYGPADLYYQHEPWKRVASRNGIERIHNAILSDLAFANLPWRAAVRESVVNGRLPLWNRFVLGGSPLLGAAQAGVLHPGTWLGIALPLALSWTFSCAFTIFLALLAGYLFFRELCRTDVAALVGAAGWGFSTFVLFWGGWAVGPSVAVFPLLLLGVRRVARQGDTRAIGLAAAALTLSFLGGHPETFFHCVAAAAVWFLWEIFSRDARRRAGRALRGMLLAGALAFGLCAPVLLPLLEAIPHTSEYAARREALARGRDGQSVSAAEATRRLLPALLPFAHGIYGRSPVQVERQDGSGMPLAYAGAVLFPLAVLGAATGRPAGGRGRALLAAFLLAGVAYGASAPILLDATSALPGFALALNYRLVFLAPFGLAGLAALGADRLAEGGSGRAFAVVCAATVAVLLVGFSLSASVFRERGLPREFVRRSFVFEVAPVLALAGVALLRRDRDRRRDVAAAAVAVLAIQRFLEMRDTYPTLPVRSLAPDIPALAVLPRNGEPYRVVATGDDFRPNGAALYGLEDVRGYESIVLRRVSETWPLWSRAQPASHNRVDDPTRPFLAFLNARYAIAPPERRAPPGWRTITRDATAAVFENPRVLPRAFAPRRVRSEPDASRRLREMRDANDFGDVAWVGGGGETRTETANGAALVGCREVGPDLRVTVDAQAPVLVATSLPAWPGWRAASAAGEIPLITVNHAFVGFRLPAGRHRVRLRYAPGSFRVGTALAAGAVLAATMAGLARRREAA